MSELIHIPGQISESQPESNPFEKAAQPSLEDVYGDCRIDKQWKSIAELEDNLRALPQATQEVVFGETVAEAHKESSEAESAVSDIFKAMEVASPEEQAKRIAQEHPLDTLKLIITFEIQKYLKDCSLVITLGNMTVKDYLSATLDHSKPQEELVDDFYNWIKNMWDKNETPFYSASEAEEIREGYYAQWKLADKELQEHDAKVRKIESELSGTPSKKRQRIKHLQRALNEAKGMPRELEKTNTQYSGRVKAVDWRRISGQANFVETLLQETKPRMNKEDFVDIWLELAKFFEKNTYNKRSDADPRVADACLQAILKWYEDTEVKEVTEVQDDQSKLDRIRSKKIALLTEQFKNLYAYLKRADRDEGSIATSVQQAQQVLRGLLKALSG